MTDGAIVLLGVASLSLTEYAPIPDRPRLSNSAAGKRLAECHRNLLQTLERDADLVLQRALEKRKWSEITSAYDALAPVEQRMFAALALFDEGRDLIEQQKGIIRRLRRQRRHRALAKEQLNLLQADQNRRAQHLVTLQHQLEVHWGELASP